MEQINFEFKVPIVMNGMTESPMMLVRHVAYNLPFKRVKGKRSRSDRIHSRVENAVIWLDKWIPDWRVMDVPVENEITEVCDDERD